MPRRKRTSGDGGRRAKVCRMVHFEEPLVISDSEHEEEEDCGVDNSSREARWRRRENRSQLQEMTEDEMLNLAMRLSAQEANSAAQRRQLEDSDIQKAIEESLHVADEDESVDASSSSAISHQSVSNEISHLRRKLSYPSQTQTHDGRKSPAVLDHVTEKESTSPLPEMPDLSQTTSSLPSSNSSALMCGPSVASQHVHESSQDKMPDRQLIMKDSEEDKLSESQPKPSPAFPRYGSFVRQPMVCVEKLSQVFISASTGLRDQLHTQNTAVGPTSASQSQEDSSLPTSYVLTQNDLRRGTDMVDDTHDQNASEGNESDTQIPDSPAYLGREGSSSKNPDPDKCKSPSKQFQPSSPSCVPENADTDVTKAPDQDQVKDQITQVENPEKGPNKQSWNKFHSHMVLHLDDDDDDDDDSEEVLSPSPVLKDKTVRKKLSRIQPCISSAAASLSPSIQDTQISQHALQEDSSKDLKSKSSDSKSLYSGLGDGDCTVSYYWGVPFCPRGQNPDDYTRVIMCQLEVYEKSLKDAQRELLRKADWSRPVFPDSSERPFGTRRLKRYRAPLLSEEEEQNDDEGEKESKRKEVEEREEAREESVEGSEDGAEGGQSETYVVLSSPENKDEDVGDTPVVIDRKNKIVKNVVTPVDDKLLFKQQKKPFLSRNQSTTATTPFRNDQWDTPDNTQIERADEEEEETQNHEQTEDEEIVCPETQLTPELMMTSPAQPPSRADSEVMEVDNEGGVPAAEEEMMEQENVSVDTAPPQRMECPMCCKLFPLSRIEMHAALCDGETDNHSQQEDDSQVVRKMRTRKDPAEESQKRTEKSAQMEKCFLCQRLFPSQQYPAHVNFCLKKTDSNISQGDDLLSALKRTEQRHTSSDEAGPSDVSSKSNRGPADSSEGSIDHSAITSSTNFIPASDDMDCRTDFQQQDSRNSQRLTRKRKFKR